jgi:hypothetical protein
MAASGANSSGRKEEDCPDMGREGKGGGGGGGGEGKKKKMTVFVRWEERSRLEAEEAALREREAEENKASGQVRSRGRAKLGRGGERAQISAIQDVIVAALVSSPSETAYLSTADCKELLLNPRVSAIMADDPPDTQAQNLRKKIAHHLDIWILRRHAALSADFCTIPCCAACPSGDISDLPSPRLDLTSAFGACTYTPPASSPRICSSTRCPLLNLPPCDIMANILQRARTVPSSRLWQNSGSHRLYKEALAGPRLFASAGGSIFRMFSYHMHVSSSSYHMHVSFSSYHMHVSSSSYDACILLLI